MAKYFYAVKEGRKIGIYNTWQECEEQVKGYKGAKYKKFSSYEDAVNFISEVNELPKPQVINLKDNEMISYVDGSFCIETKTYSYGVVIITKDGKETFSGRENDEEMAQMRNVAGEIKGAMFAMNLALERNKDILYLHYDYKGIENWAKGIWKTNKDGTKYYKEYYDSIKDKLKVEFIKVKAHTGVVYNEEADRLAKEAILS